GPAVVHEHAAGAAGAPAGGPGGPRGRLVSAAAAGGESAAAAAAPPALVPPGGQAEDQEMGQEAPQASPPPAAHETLCRGSRYYLSHGHWPLGGSLSFQEPPKGGTPTKTDSSLRPGAPGPGQIRRRSKCADLQT